MHNTLIEQHGFKLLEQIDDTLHTEIWKANQLELDRIVCLQILKPEAARHALEFEHFLLIARTFAKVKSETVAAVFDIVSTADIHYVVMEYVDGPTVGSLVSNGRKLSQAQILQIASSLALCFEQLWQKDHIIHRNLKGETVQLDPRGVAKLTDFSLAVIASQDLAALDSGHIVGTPSFIAPEYAQGSKHLNTQADMYSFGALMYQLATGSAPFSSLSPVEALGAQIRGQIPPPHVLNKEITLEFSWFVHRLMMKNPNNRYSDWRAVLNDIRLLTLGEALLVQAEECFLSTIDAKPLLDAMQEGDGVAADAAEEMWERGARTGPSVKFKPSAQKITAMELEHKREIRRSTISLVVLMTLLMCFWFCGFFWYRGVWEPELRRMEKSTVTTKQDVRLPPPPAVVVPPAKKEDDHVAESAPSIPQPPTLPPALPAPAPTNDVVPPVAPRLMPEELKKALVIAAKAGDLEAMRAAFISEKSLFMDKEGMKPVLNKAPTAYKLLERTMDAKKDQPIAFVWRGQPRIVVPREVTETSVTLEVNGRRQEIKFSDLAPDEMVSLVNKPRTESEALSYCLMLMSTTQKSEIPLYASKCPLFQDILLAALQE